MGPRLKSSHGIDRCVLFIGQAAIILVGSPKQIGALPFWGMRRAPIGGGDAQSSAAWPLTDPFMVDNSLSGPAPGLHVWPQALLHQLVRNIPYHMPGFSPYGHRITRVNRCSASFN